jgi:hypothetical protein
MEKLDKASCASVPDSLFHQDIEILMRLLQQQ